MCNLFGNNSSACPKYLRLAWFLNRKWFRTEHRDKMQIRAHTHISITAARICVQTLWHLSYIYMHTPAARTAYRHCIQFDLTQYTHIHAYAHSRPILGRLACYARLADRVDNALCLNRHRTPPHSLTHDSAFSTSNVVSRREYYCLFVWVCVIYDVYLL